MNALFKPWFIECTLQTLLHWVHSSNPGSLDAPYKPWFIGCTLWTLVHWVHPTNPSSLGALFKPWFIGCTLQTLVPWVHSSTASDPAAGWGGQETWNLCGCLWQPSSLWLVCTGLGGPWPPQHPQICYCFKPWFIGCTLRTLVHWVHPTNPGSLGALFKPWFIGCTLQYPGSLGAPYKPWFIGCTLPTLVRCSLPKISGWFAVMITRSDTRGGVISKSSAFSIVHRRSAVSAAAAVSFYIIFF